MSTPIDVNVTGLVYPELPEGMRFAARHSEPDVWPPFPSGVTILVEVQTPYKTLWWNQWGWEYSMPRYHIDLRDGVESANEVLRRMAREATDVVAARALVS